MTAPAILVVEDNPATRGAVGLVLKKAGFEVLEAATGEAALALLARRRPDLVLQDLVLPDVDGFKLATELRLRLETPRVPLLAFSVLLAGAQDARIAAAGFDGLVEKPVEARELVQTIQSHLRRAPGPSADRASQGRALLVADDDPARQAGSSESLARRCSLLEAELSILTRISGALSQGDSLDSALDRVLAGFFDAAAIATGALVLFDPIRVHAFGGAAKAGATYFHELDELRAILAAGQPLHLPPAGEQLPLLQAALDRDGIRWGFVVPVSHQAELLGLLLVGSRASPALEDDRLAFAVGVAGQIAQGVALARAFAARSAAQEQLMVADRMASVGTLAAGVAHEINNPLAAVVANLDFAVAGMGKLAAEVGGSPRIAELRECLKDAAGAAQRVRFIVRDLKIFSRPDQEKTGPVHVQLILESTLRMAWNEIRHRARLSKLFGQTPPVQASESRLGQVFLNLIVNAAQAIPEGDAEHNEIRVSTCFEPPKPGAGPAGRVVVEISDTGSGMPPEVLQRLFTPFFTTKPIGVGTGLGLSICRSLVTGFGGSIEVQSEVGKGTVFRVSLPPASTVAQPQPPEASSETTARRRGRILVVDDDPVVAKAVQRSLAEEHEVVASGGATEALARIRGGDRFDVIFCDLMMPQMTGMDLHAELARTAPDQAARMIFLTGGAFTPRARAFLDEAPNQRLEKPFDAAQLRARVAERLA